MQTIYQQSNQPINIKMSDPVKDQIAQEKFGKNFDELDSE